MGLTLSINNDAKFGSAVTKSEFTKTPTNNENTKFL